MTYLLAALGGLVGAVLGALVGILIMTPITAMLGVSNFEGARGIAIVWLGGPIGGLAGLLLGLWLVLRFHGGYSGWIAIGSRSVLIIAAMIAATAAGIWLKLATDGTLNRNAAKPQAIVQIRLPPGSEAKVRGLQAELTSDREVTEALVDRKVRMDGGQPTVSAIVELRYRTSNRLLSLKLPDGTAQIFALKIAGTPVHHDSYGAWQAADFVAGSGEQPRKATGSEGFQIRYRVRDPNVEYSLPTVRFELSTTDDGKLPAREAIDVHARNGDDTNKGFIREEWRHGDDGRVTISGHAQLSGRTKPLVAIAWPGEPARLFAIALPAEQPWLLQLLARLGLGPREPRAEAQFSPWRNADFIEAPDQPPQPAPTSDRFRFRYYLD